MSILLLEAVKIVKSFADRLILDVKEFRIYSGDKIGFIGDNGSGKTTLLNILAGTLEPDSGTVKRYCGISYIEQFGDTDTVNGAGGQVISGIDGKRVSKYGVKDKIGKTNLSGGEAARIKIAGAMSGGHRLVFADEPTSNLDAEGIDRFCGELEGVESFVLISHDRAILNRLCNKIMTLENHQVVLYEGGYDDFAVLRDAKRERAVSEYEQYSAEKSRLMNVYSEKKRMASKVAKKPVGVSSSEQKMRDFTSTSRSNDKRQRSFERAANAVLARAEHMEVKEKPAEVVKIKIDFNLTEPPQNKIVISGKDITFAYGNKTIFDSASFSIKNGSRTAVCGENGSGKTTLFNMIMDNQLIYRVPRARIGYFYQGFENIDFTKTILQNAMENSIQNETIVRGVLARLLFGRGDVNKPASVLSGGERIRLNFAKLLVSKINILMLDEPTNYLDMQSIEVLQSILTDYEGTILFVSHDRAFVNAVCTDLLVIRDKRIIPFEGNLDSYDKKLSIKSNQNSSGEKMLIEHRLAELNGLIARAKDGEKEMLEARYLELSDRLRRI